MSSHPGRWTVVLAGCLWAGLVGCEAKTVVEVVPVSEVAVAPSSVSLAVGATQQLGVSLKGSGGHALGGRTVTWSSSNASVATVSQAGLVTGVGAGTATITATSEGRSGSAMVAVPTYTLSVAKGGTGSGTVTSSPAGIDCGASCSASYASGTVVTLTATAASGSVFAGWGGSCSGSGSTCQVAMSQVRSVTATFNVQMYALKVGMAGTGSGTVTSSPAGIDCGTACEANYASGTVVTLTATARSGSTFQGWSGACSGTASTCQVTMSQARSVTATFNVQMYTLTVTRAGTGSGTVTSSPSGINCGAACQASYASGTVVTLTATAASGSVFTGWSGACTGSATTCQVTMSQARSVTATFSVQVYALKVGMTGTGSGTVTSSPAGIDCGTACEADFAHGTVVTLTVTARSGSTFTGWSGACTGTASTCQVTMSAHRSVTTTFNTSAANLGVGFGPEQFSLIPVGTFQMGDITGAGLDRERPVHPVSITRAFYMQKTEVTQGQWRQVMGTNPSHFSDCGDLCPVERVSWNDVQTFLAALNTMDPGKGYRLPTEAEWEYAARAGTAGDYGGTGVLDQMGWYEDNSGSRTHPVAQKQPNHWGLFDMHGNVWEWVQDWYSATYYQYCVDNGIVNDPPGPATGTNRVLRGGSAVNGATFARSATRTFGLPSDRYLNGGFRLARTQ